MLIHIFMVRGLRVSEMYITDTVPSSLPRDEQRLMMELCESHIDTATVCGGGVYSIYVVL